VLSAVAALSIGVAALLAARSTRPPTSRLAPRLRPYTVVSRHALGLSIEPAARRAQPRIPRSAGSDLRVRQLLRGAVGAALGGGAIAVVFRAPFAILAATAAGFVVGATGVRRRIERERTARAERIRLELYTVNQLLAIHVRTGAGPVQAVQRVVDRGHGAVVDELGDVLTWMRSGMAEVDAFARAADITPEPSAARTYRLLAASADRGGDLGRSLLALSTDLRDQRRALLHKAAVRRRAAMLLPTIGLLAPIMLLFIAAPLPSIVLGYR
jgi:Flp pilus assembly protein TadB